MALKASAGSAQPERPVQAAQEFAPSDRHAMERTALAYDRTLLAWIRTALGVIGFGFTFYKFFEYLKEHALAGGAHGHALISPRQYAILLITAGTLALIWATVQYSQAMKRIRRIDPAIPRSRTPVLAIFMTAIGLLTMIAAILRL